jgi:short-subunit dehydrogenase
MGTFNAAGGTAVVTGAASGIGEALAYDLAARGCDLVLLDKEGDRLSTVVSTIQSRHSTVDVAPYVVDLASTSDTIATAEAILADHPRIRLLVNNAGVALGGRFDQVTLDEFNLVIDINFRATVTLTHRLLPALKAEPGSHLVNLSSLFGIIAPGGQAAYSASKFAVRGFTEALRQEMQLAKHPVKVTTVHPGGIKTNIVRNMTAVDSVDKEKLTNTFDKKLANTTPEKAARIILEGVRKNKARVLVGPDATALDLIVRVTGSGYQRLFSTVMSRMVPEAR